MQNCAVSTLGVRNAFNSDNWHKVLRALEDFNVPEYLLRIISSYFHNRVLEYETEEGCKSYKVTGGVPQGSVLGPTLWNAMYDGVLRLELPEEATIVGYADDIALVVVDKRLSLLEAKCNDAIARVQWWLNNAGLELAAQKTAAVLISARKKKETMRIMIGDHEILSQESIKYLGLTIDSRLSYKHHPLAVSDKAEKINGARKETSHINSRRLCRALCGPNMGRSQKLSH